METSSYEQGYSAYSKTRLIQPEIGNSTEQNFNDASVKILQVTEEYNRLI